MLEKILKRASWSDLIISAIFVLFGVFLVTNPDTVTTMLSVILGAIFIALGAFKIIEYMSKGKEDTYLLGIGAVAIVIGIIIMFATGIILSLFRIIIGIWIIYTAIMNLHTVLTWKAYQSRLWLATVLGSVITLIAGIYVLVNSGALIQTVGYIIIIYGIVDIIERAIFIKKVDNYLK